MKKKLILLPLLAVILIVALVVATGCAGDAGLKGARGLKGIQGEQGESGLQGEIGPQGDAGIRGAGGRTGLKGTVGSAGATGEQGIQGERGLTRSGARGTTGATGPAGEDGEDYNSQDLLDLQEQIDVLIASIATIHPPQMEGIFPLVLSTSTPEVLTGTVELVFDFSDVGGDLRDLMIDWSLEPYTQERKAQTNFLATEDMGIDPGVLAAMALVGLVPSYDAEEQTWTLSINTNATMTQAILDTGIFGWVVAVGDPVFPAGRYDWYIEVRDRSGNKWGYNESPPEYAHYVNYFHSAPE